MIGGRVLARKARYHLTHYVITMTFGVYVYIYIFMADALIQTDLQKCFYIIVEVDYLTF